MITYRDVCNAGFGARVAAALNSHRACLAAALLLAAHCALADSAAPDLLLVHGKVFTASDTHPYVEALAIRGERIVAVGDTVALTALADAHTRRVDLGGRTVIPGINDAHNHLDVQPADVVAVRTESPDPSWTEMRKALATRAANTPSGTLLEGDILTTIFNDTSVDRVALDEITRDHPVILTTITGHAAICNSAALERAGIGEGTPDPLGGRFERDAAGRLTGVAREYAALQLDRRLADSTPDVEAARQLRETLAQAAAWGITTIQDMSNGLPPARAVSLMTGLPPSIRIRVMRMPGTMPQGRDIREGRPVPRGTPLIRVSGTKWMLDGVPLEMTLDPRGSHPWPKGQGLDEGARTLPMTFPQAQLQMMLRETLADRDQLLLHVSGYPAAAAMLQAMQDVGGASVWASRRVRFEHGDGLFPDLIPRARALGIVVVQNPTHFAFLGEDVQKVAQPVRTLIAAGVPVALGSDGPTNPYLNIMLAVTHPDQHSEGITREQAVIAYTRTSAYAEFTDKDKGTLEPGKLADLAVLSQDIFEVPLTDLPKTKSLLTLVGGRTVFDAGKL